MGAFDTIGRLWARSVERSRPRSSRARVDARAGATLPPALDFARELLVAGVVEGELLAPKPAEAAKHLGEDRGRESAVLLGCEPAQSLEPVTGLDGHEVDEVARPAVGRSRSTASPLRPKKSRSRVFR
jgi:hypothetical protein